MTHQLLEHTADLRGTCEGPEMAGLLQSAVDLVREVLAGDSLVQPRELRAIPVEGDATERLFRFLRELLYLYDVEGFLPARVEDGACPRVWGEPFDPQRHFPERQIKAVTRHEFRLERKNGNWHADVLFDV